MLKRDAPLWLLVVGFFGCHVSFEALNESLVNLPQVPKSALVMVMGECRECRNFGFNADFYSSVEKFRK